MNYFDDELKIIEKLQKIDTKSVWLATGNNDEEEVFQSIFDKDQWSEWTNSSKKSDPPPDFYNDKLKLMMDVMRIDDHTFVNDAGKLVNPTNMRESVIQKEIKESGILDIFPNVKSVKVNAVTDLPTDKDHNYNFYYQSFVRTLNKHSGNIDLYRKNHMGYKTIFLIFDESSAYIRFDKYINQAVIKGEPHYWFFDKAFVDVIKQIRADYIIWFAPFKYYQVVPNTNFDELPQVCVFSVSELNNLNEDLISYNSAEMKSIEK